MAAASLFLLFSQFREPGATLFRGDGTALLESFFFQGFAGSLTGASIGISRHVRDKIDPTASPSGERVEEPSQSLAGGH
jgi:hypothetical protein